MQRLDESGASIPQKKAALLLHSLPQAAQRAALEKLPAPSRSRMRELLLELSELGIPAGRQWLDLRDTDTLTLQQQLASAPAEFVVQALKTQSPQTIQLIWRIQIWPWAQQVFSHLPVASQAIVKELDAASAAVPTSLVKSLVQSTLEQVRACQAQVAPMPHCEPSGIKGVFKRWFS